MDLGIGHARTMYMLYASRTPGLIQLVRKRLKLFFGLPKILWASLGKSLENFSSLNSSVRSFGRAAEVKYLRIRLHLTGVYINMESRRRTVFSTPTSYNIIPGYSLSHFLWGPDFLESPASRLSLKHVIQPPEASPASRLSLKHFIQPPEALS
jgi:hypothetical protein